MNAQMKKRLIVVSGIVIIVLITVLAIVGGGTAARAVSVAEAAELADAGQKIQVSGNVVSDSYSTDGKVLNFKIYDPDGDPATQLAVSYDGAASSTFGNDVTAICTGRVDGSGVLQCSELVTKCPSKYESSTTALSVDRLLDYGDGIVGKTVKVAGVVAEGTLQPAGQGERFTLVDGESAQPSSLAIDFNGALPEGVADGSTVVVTGSLSSNGSFNATDLALEG